MLWLTVAFTLLLRLQLADRRSYWLDELYSVYAYTVQPSGPMDAIATLAETSIHPPLYQAILYQWVALFGDGEVATRMLSSLFVAVAVVALHQLVVRQFDRRTADVAAVVFAVSYAVTYYGAETRSYAQTLMLATLSMSALDRWVRRPRTTGRPFVPSTAVVAFTLVNVGLLLTHYYNAFFLAAQALLVVGYLLARGRGTAARDVTRTVGVYTLQLGLFLVVWGRQAVASYRDDSGNYDTARPDNGPLDIAGGVLEEHLTVGTLAPVVLLVGCAAALVVGGWLLRGGGTDPTAAPAAEVAAVAGTHRAVGDRDGGGGAAAFGLLHAGWMSIAPAAVAWLGFLVVQAERYHTRYFLYLVPAFTILATWLALWVLDAVLGRLPTDGVGGVARRWLALPAVLPLLLAGLLTLPGGYDAMTEEKADWRGTAADVAAIVASHPDLDIAIYETSFRTDPMLDHYLRRHDDELRVDGVIRRHEEENDHRPFAIEDDIDDLRDRDLLIVPFIHHTVRDMPKAIDLLDRAFTRHLVQIDDDGRGLLVYRTDPPN